MKRALLFAVVVLGYGLFPGAGAAETIEDGSCATAVAASSSERYQRLHQIPTRDDKNLPMVTPGGMILEVPKMVAATDVLTILERNAPAFCFHLVTFGRNRHRCELSGIAQLEGGSYVFRDGAAVVRFTLLNADQIRVEPLGDAYRSRCESSAAIESAIYSRQASALRSAP